VGPLSLIDTWPVSHVAAAIITADGDVSSRGDTSHLFRIASLAKVVTTWAVLVAVEEGSISLDQPVGQPGCTLRHLLSHAGGYGFDGVDPIAQPGRRRIYSNTGIELAANALSTATGIAFGEYLREAILQPLSMNNTELHGSPAHAIWSTVDDLVRFLGEIMHPTLLSNVTVRDATSPQFADLPGVVPGVGSFRPCPWGLGVEIHGDKSPHWMGAANSPTTFGHFGGAGTMMWIDPECGIGVVALTDRMFDEWRDVTLRVWPQFSDAVISEGTSTH
jgi:CubicO group peptidase (beta-lactamase class C family)